MDDGTRQGRAAPDRTGLDGKGVPDRQAVAGPGEPIASSQGIDGAANATAATSVWASPVVDEFLAYQCRFAEGLDARGQAAHLVTLYSHHLCLAAGGPFVRAGMVADLDPSRVRIRFAPVTHPVAADRLEARRFAFSFDAGVLPDAGDPSKLFHDAVIAHMEPVIAALHRRTGLSHAAQWRLVADSIAGAFLDIGQASHDEAGATHAALAIVKRRPSPLFSAALRYETIVSTTGCAPASRTFRLRGGCCLVYKSKDGAMCDSCVRLDAATQRERLRRFLDAGV